MNTTDIQEKSQTSYTAPCNGVVSYGAQMGVFGFLLTMQKQVQNESVYDLRMPCSVLHMFIFTLVLQ